jgi:hypothetical protein
VTERQRLDAVALQVTAHLSETGAALGDIAEAIGRAVEGAVAASESSQAELAELLARSEAVQAVISTEIGAALAELAAAGQRLEDASRRVGGVLTSASGLRPSLERQARSFGSHLRVGLALITGAIAIGVVGELLLR